MVVVPTLVEICHVIIYLIQFSQPHSFLCRREGRLKKSEQDFEQTYLGSSGSGQNGKICLLLLLLILARRAAILSGQRRGSKAQRALGTNPLSSLIGQM